MTITARSAKPLPHWETPPTNLASATRDIKRALRERIAASGRTVEEVFAVVEDKVRAEVTQIDAELTRGESVWPEIDFDDVAAGTAPSEQLEKLRTRGCAVIRGTFSRRQAEAWDSDIVDYVEGNRFFESYRGPGDDFFESVGSKPEIYPIYWSSAQMEARQHPRMAQVQSLLNSLWTHHSLGRDWFDPNQDSLYPDRIRRRPPGANSGGLGTHLDTGTLDLWMTQGYQEHFRHLFDGSVEAYDPWDAAYRTEAAQYPGSTMCSVFRTFQGWTALSEMRFDQGVLHTVPIPEAMAYLMLRPLLDDVPEDEMCGVRPNRTFPANTTYHKLLVDAQVGIPTVRPGDTVWWHCDLIHAVASVEDQQGWGNVMYIPAAPRCAKNEAYAKTVLEAFRAGNSPGDFPEENYEAGWPNRFTEDQLNEIGRRGLGLVG